MQIEEIKLENIIQLDLDGRIDVTSAPQLQEAILTAFKKVNSVVLNMAGVNYLSSAGLRALLIGQKTADSKNGKMKLINVNDSVKKIIEISGFGNIFAVE